MLDSRDRQGTTERDNATFGRGVRDQERPAEKPDRRGHDHAAIALLRHRCPRRTTNVERTEHVDVEVLDELIQPQGRHLVDGKISGVVDNDVHGPVMLQRSCDDRVRTGLRGDISAAGDGFASSGNDLVGHCSSRKRIAAAARECATEIVDDDPGATSGKGMRVRAPDPASRARDNSHPAIEPKLMFVLRSHPLPDLFATINQQRRYTKVEFPRFAGHHPVHASEPPERARPDRPVR